jgi:hypothetical protein
MEIAVRKETLPGIALFGQLIRVVADLSPQVGVSSESGAPDNQPTRRGGFPGSLGSGALMPHVGDDPERPPVGHKP